MGCGVSKFRIADEGGHSSWRIHRGNDGAVVDSCLLSKPFPEGGEGDQEHAKGDHNYVQDMNMKKEIINSDQEIGGINQKIEKDHEKALDMEKIDQEGGGAGGHDRDDSIEYTKSLSFRVYCLPISQSSDDEIDNNSEGEANAGKITDQQEMEVENNKKRRNARFMRKGTIGKGIKTGSAKFKSKLHNLYNNNPHNHIKKI